MPDTKNLNMNNELLALLHDMGSPANKEKFLHTG